MGFLADIQVPQHYNILYDCYINIKMFSVKKYGSFYLINITYNIFQSYQDRLDERTPLYEKTNVISIDFIPKCNILEFIYDKLKKIFENTTDL